MRVILRCNRYARICDMLEALNFMSIKERIDFNVCILVYKIINGMCPNYLCNNIEFVQNEDVVTTRQRGNIYISRCKTREEQKMLLHDGFKMYNNLPNEIKREQRMQGFKKMLAQHIKGRERETAEILYN